MRELDDSYFYEVGTNGESLDLDNNVNIKDFLDRAHVNPDLIMD